jgi:hypothetical protein
MTEHERDAQDSVQLKLRCRESLRARIEKRAAENGRSLNNEMVRRLEQSLEVEDLLEKAKAMYEESTIRAIRAAGLGIVRDLDGRTMVQISQERLLDEASGILRSGFGAEEDIDKNPLELAIERGIARGVREVLDKLGIDKPNPAARNAA